MEFPNSEVSATKKQSYFIAASLIPDSEISFISTHPCGAYASLPSDTACQIKEHSTLQSRSKNVGKHAAHRQVLNDHLASVHTLLHERLSRSHVFCAILPASLGHQRDRGRIVLEDHWHIAHLSLFNKEIMTVQHIHHFVRQCNQLRFSGVTGAQLLLGRHRQHVAATQSDH